MSDVDASRNERSGSIGGSERCGQMHACFKNTEEEEGFTIVNILKFSDCFFALLPSPPSRESVETPSARRTSHRINPPSRARPYSGTPPMSDEGTKAREDKRHISLLAAPNEAARNLWATDARAAARRTNVGGRPDKTLRRLLRSRLSVHESSQPLHARRLHR